MEKEITTPMGDLKPCPFCGKNYPTVSIYPASIADGDESFGFYVICGHEAGGCGASSGWAASEEIAINLWNKRR